MDLDDLTAQQRLLAEELLGWETPRPRADASLPGHLLSELEAGVAAAAARIPPKESLFLGKSSLDALVCDGRYLDQQETAFTWGRDLAIGTLAHRAIELDWHGRRERPVDEVIETAFDLLSSADSNMADWLNRLHAAERAELKGTARQDLLDFREAWPLLPPAVDVRLEHALRITLAGGRIRLQGTPDLVIGSVRDDRARLLIVDFKTGWPREHLQDELRFYGLLATLKHHQIPWRWGVHFVRGGRWELEDASRDLLETTVQRVVRAVERAVALRWGSLDERAPELNAGPWCAWCGREPTCPAATAR